MDIDNTNRKLETIKLKDINRLINEMNINIRYKQIDLFELMEDNND